MREPSLHIGKQQLDRLIAEWIQTSKLAAKSDSLVKYLFKNGKKYSLRHRSILESSEQTQEKTSRIKNTPIALALEFSKLCTVLRKKKYKHSGVRLITQSDTAQWQHVLIASAMAIQFCRDHRLKYRDGFLAYLEIAIGFIKPWGYNRIKAFDEKIRQFYDAFKEINNDPNLVGTNTIYELYQQKVYDKTGITLKYNDRPDEFIHFVRASAIAKKINVHPKHFIVAQFEQLDFTNGYPSPNQLSSFKAEERALRWITENGIRIKRETFKMGKRQAKFLAKFINKDEDSSKQQ
jgi:hypothetical protein